MATATVSSSNTYPKKLADLDAGVRSGMTTAGLFYIRLVKRVFEINNPRGHATGRMVRSLTVAPVKLNLNGVYHLRAGPTVDYSWWVHQGTGPLAGKPKRKMPPVDVIYEWIKEKGIVPTFRTANKSSTGRSSSKKRRRSIDVERERRALAFLIARKIGEKGTLPFPFMTSALLVGKNDMKRILIESIRRSLGRR